MFFLDTLRMRIMLMENGKLQTEQDVSIQVLENKEHTVLLFYFSLSLISHVYIKVSQQDVTVVLS